MSENNVTVTVAQWNDAIGAASDKDARIAELEAMTRGRTISCICGGEAERAVGRVGVLEAAIRRALREPGFVAPNIERVLDFALAGTGSEPAAEPEPAQECDECGGDDHVDGVFCAACCGEPEPAQPDARDEALPCNCPPSQMSYGHERCRMARRKLKEGK